jgi:hypothetical protein
MNHDQLWPTLSEERDKALQEFIGKVQAEIFPQIHELMKSDEPLTMWGHRLDPIENNQQRNAMEVIVLKFLRGQQVR